MKYANMLVIVLYQEFARYRTPLHQIFFGTKFLT